jgi:predicted Zn-ribbon and HTH transcriptional regulator
VASGTTRRQEIANRLQEREWDVRDLRRELGLTVRLLEEDLRHVQRSARCKGFRFIVRPARCSRCGFSLARVSLHPPGRCPSCRHRHVDGPWVQLVTV